MLSTSIFPGAQLVNAFPIRACALDLSWAPLIPPSVKYVPEWFPGTWYHSFARRSRELTRKMRFDPLAKVKEQMVCSASRLPNTR
jgi:hypothetical protein